jgi:hypothetical protein
MISNRNAVGAIPFPLVAHKRLQSLLRLLICLNRNPTLKSLQRQKVSRLTSAATMNRDLFDHATSEIASTNKLGIDATKKLPGEGFKRPWPPLIKMDAAVKAKVEGLFGGNA